MAKSRSNGIRAWHLPWEQDNVPHALIDIIRGCNISCAACYNLCKNEIRSLDDIRADLDVIFRERRPDSISIVGGEVTMHPGLCDVVKMIRSRGAAVEIFTNGVLLDEKMAGDLKRAGADLIFLHIEATQKRPDLPVNANWRAVEKLLDAKVSLIAAGGMEAGLAITVNKNNLDEMRELIDYTFRNPSVAYLLVTLQRDVSKIAWIAGDIKTGLTGKLADPDPADQRDRLTIRKFHDLLRENPGVLPFACVGSNREKNDIRWLSYLVGTVYSRQAKITYRSLRASLVERLFTYVFYKKNGRYPFYQPQNALRFKLQLFLNAFTGGNLLGNFKLLRASLRKDAVIRAKKLLFQNPAEVAENGVVTHCRNCPDATARGGRMIPICIIDKVADVNRNAGEYA